MEFDSLVNKKKIVLTCKNLQDGDIKVLAEVLEKSTAVEEMNLMMNQITLSDDKFTDALARNKSLKVLNLYGNKIGAEVCTTSSTEYAHRLYPEPLIL
jgi:acylphosphatase